MTQIKRKLYKRGSSFETTIPMPLLFALDKSKKHNVLFNFDKHTNRWYVEFAEQEVNPNSKTNGGKKK
jgi:hypothetical protein